MDLGMNTNIQKEKKKYVCISIWHIWFLYNAVHIKKLHFSVKPVFQGEHVRAG